MAFFELSKLLSGLGLFIALMTVRASKEKSLTQLIPVDAEAHLRSFSLQTTNMWSFRCRDTKTSRSEELKCSLSLQEYSFDKNKTARDKNNEPCDVSLKLPDNHKMGLITNIYPLSANQVIVTWTEIDKKNDTVFLKLLDVDTRDCPRNISTSSRELTVELGPIFNKWFILTTNETFEVAYDDKKNCRGWCSQTFDHQGNKIKGLKNFTVDHGRVDNFIYPNSYNLVLSKSDKCPNLESQRRLHAGLFFWDKFIFTYHSIQRWGNVSISTDFGILSICHLDENQEGTLRCTRRDLSRETPPLKFDYPIQNFLVSSLPSGGYVTLTSKLVGSKNKRKSLQFFLTEFNESGESEQHMEVAHMRCQSKFTMARAQIFQDEEGKACVSLLDTGSNILTAKCFPN